MRPIRLEDIPIAETNLSHLKGDIFASVPSSSQLATDAAFDQIMSDRPDLYFAAVNAMRAPAVAGTSIGWETADSLERLADAKGGKASPLAPNKTNASIRAAARAARAPAAAAHPVISLALLGQVQQMQRARARGDDEGWENARDRLMLTAGVAAGFDMLMGVDEVAAQIKSAIPRALAGEKNVLKHVAAASARRPATGLATLIAAGFFGDLASGL
jgi:hypothetical protein